MSPGPIIGAGGNLRLDRLTADIRALFCPHLFEQRRGGDIRSVWRLRHVSITEHKDVSKGEAPARRLEISPARGGGALGRRRRRRRSSRRRRGRRANERGGASPRPDAAAVVRLASRSALSKRRATRSTRRRSRRSFSNAERRFVARRRRQEPTIEARPHSIELDVKGRAFGSGARRTGDGDDDHRGAEGGPVIGPTGAVRVMVATNPSTSARAPKAWRRWCARSWRPTRSTARFTSSAPSARTGSSWCSGTARACACSPSGSKRAAFRWPKIENGVMRLSAAQLSALLEGSIGGVFGRAKDTVAPQPPG